MPITDRQIDAALDAWFRGIQSPSRQTMREIIEAADAAAWCDDMTKAPKNGTPVLMAQQPDGIIMLYPRYCVASYQTLPGGGEILIDWQYGGKPTHFRYFEPLPEPPK